MIINRRGFGLFLTALLGVRLLAANSPEPAGVSQRDRSMAAGEAGVLNVEWHDVKDWGVEGREWINEERLDWFDRFPAAAQSTVNPKVWTLSRDSTGMMVRFKTDATSLHVHYKVTQNKLASISMPAAGVSGIDFYARDAQGGWRWVQVTKPDQPEMKVEVIKDLLPGYREYAAYLPLRNGVEFLLIGVPAGAKIEGLAPRAKPIVFYGTSITQGLNASRPGMVHTAILGRRLDRPVVNLGFAGNGRMDPAVGDYLAKVDAAAFVIDCLPNMNPALVAERTLPLVNQLRAAAPTTPIILVEDRRYTNDWITPAQSNFHTRNHAALRVSLNKLQSAGASHLYYIPGAALFGDDTEGSSDGSHPTDLGFMRQADVMEPVLRTALEGLPAPKPYLSPIR